MAVVLLRGGLALDLVQSLVAAWVVEMRYGYVNSLDQDFCDGPAPPYGHKRWAEHPLFTQSWMEDMGTSWDDLQEEVREPPKRFE